MGLQGGGREGLEEVLGREVGHGLQRAGGVLTVARGIQTPSLLRPDRARRRASDVKAEGWGVEYCCGHSMLYVLRIAVMRLRRLGALRVRAGWEGAAGSAGELGRTGLGMPSGALRQSGGAHPVHCAFVGVVGQPMIAVITFLFASTALCERTPAAGSAPQHGCARMCSGAARLLRNSLTLRHRPGD